LQVEYNILQQLNSGVKGNVECMKAEKYLLDYIEQSHISKERVREVIGIDIENLVKNHQDLEADEFIRMCVFLGVNPDDVMNAII